MSEIGTDKAEAASTTERIKGAIDSLRERIYNSRDSFRSRVDRLVGSQGLNCEEDGPRPSAPGTMGAIEEALDLLGDEVSALEEEAKRFVSANL